MLSRLVEGATALVFASHAEGFGLPIVEAARLEAFATAFCLSTDATGAATTVNVESETFPVDAAGNGEARVHVGLPSPCYAPIVFVANGNAAGAWFAVSGA